MKNPIRSLRKIMYILIGILFFGIIGYMIIEDYSFGEAFYMTIQTVSTVGFNEVQPFRSWGREFTGILIVLSFGTFAYGISQMSQVILSGSLKSYLKYKNVQKRIDELSGHIIICGYGRNGVQAARTLKAYKESFVIIESNAEKLQGNLYGGIPLVGDATVDEVLLKAGVDRASALISSLHNDSDNVFVVISARQLNPKLNIVSRANEDTTGKKLLAAGADSTVMPNKVGGMHLAHTLLKPDIVQFLDHISVGGSSATNIEEILVDEIPQRLSAHNIQELEIRKQTGCTVIGFKPHGKEFIINPGAELELERDSKLFVLGNEEQILKLKKLFNINL